MNAPWAPKLPRWLRAILAVLVVATAALMPALALWLELR